jgi:hypothetical protein
VRPPGRQKIAWAVIASAAKTAAPAHAIQCLHTPDLSVIVPEPVAVTVSRRQHSQVCEDPGLVCFHICVPHSRLVLTRLTLETGYGLYKWSRVWSIPVCTPTRLTPARTEPIALPWPARQNQNLSMKPACDKNSVHATRELKLPGFSSSSIFVKSVCGAVYTHVSSDKCTQRRTVSSCSLGHCGRPRSPFNHVDTLRVERPLQLRGADALTRL